METPDIEKRTLNLTRTFDAPISIVWAAWTQPEHIAKWWSRGMPTEIKKHQFYVGGEWEYSMKMPNGGEFRSFGKYSQIIPQELIETSANFIPMTEGVTIVARFCDEGEKTEFTFSVIHPTEAYCRQQEQMGFYNGWGSVFNALHDYLKTL